MSEKFKNVQRKVNKVISLLPVFIPAILLAIAWVAFVFLLVTALRGAIISICWNVAMTTMFGFQKISIFQAFVLSFTLSCLKLDFIIEIKSVYTKITGTISNMIQKEKIAKILSVIFTALLGTISILLSVWLVMYSWNNILPNLLNIELCHIDFAQAFGFAFLFNLVFGISKSEDTKSKKGNESGDNVTQAESVEDITENTSN